MSEIDVFKQKLSELAKLCGEIRTATESHAKNMDVLKTQKELLETTMIAARDEHRKFIASASDYQTEFSKNKLEAQKDLERQKVAAAQMVQLAQAQKAESERLVLEAQSKLLSAEGKLKDAEVAKTFWESRRESIKSFLTSGV